jgi:hypothetical protein
MTLHCNLPQNHIVLKCLKLNSKTCVQYGLQVFCKVNVSRGPWWATEQAGVSLVLVAGGLRLRVFTHALLVIFFPPQVVTPYTCFKHKENLGP